MSMDQNTQVLLADWVEGLTSHLQSHLKEWSYQGNITRVGDRAQAWLKRPEQLLQLEPSTLNVYSLDCRTRPYTRLSGWIGIRRYHEMISQHLTKKVALLKPQAP